MDFRRERINFSSSSASASSSSQFKWVFPSSNGPRTGTEPQIYSHHQDGHHQRSSWHETQEESSRSTTPKFELMTEDSHLALQNSNIQKEHMFDKVVTPSDVGKLNRLVIPKQHAEKHFPLDSSTNEKGLLLNFEDRAGKPWRFRYSYWNSSQSYVMTKGWSRFVKEMKLDAGDIVSFQRGVGESSKDRLYIDWRRRPNPLADTSFPHSFAFRQSVPWTSPLFFRPPPATVFQHNNIISYNYNSAVNPCPGSIIYLRSAAAPRDEGGIEPMVFDSVPVVHGKAAVKRLRLFGVNMECAAVSSESDESNAAAILASQSRLYNGIQLQPHFLNNGKSSSMSLDLDI